MNIARRLAALVLVGFVVLAAPGAAQTADPTLTLERIFSTRDFQSERFGPARWMRDGQSYTTLERSEDAKGGRELVLYDAASGARRVLVPAARLVPDGAPTPLPIDDYAWSPDGQVLIVFTNSKRVWRRNTRGDYWTYDMRTGRLRKLGAGFEASSLMFAKLSPDGRLAAYVVKHNLYMEDLASGTITPLTKDGNDDIVNGTSDWVYEEEFDLRDGFRWSPDSRAIAFWRFDTSGVPEFAMIDNTDALYPTVTRFRYPKAGETNSAVQVGVVRVADGRTVWMKTAGDARQIYIPRLEWNDSSREVVFQQLNRLQNTNQVIVGNAETGDVRTIFTDRDEAWVDVEDFTESRKGFLWLSERDGWRHVYLVPRDGREARLLTSGDYDIVSIDGVDEDGGWLYVTASPSDATKRFVYRVALDGGGKLELVGPPGQSGVHRCDVAPSGKWAFHSYSSLDTPPVTELVRLPSGAPVRTLTANAELKAKVEALARRRVEFFTLRVDGGMDLDGWRILPPGFDPAKKYPLLVYVYGEPAGQTVQDSWGGNTYLWHLMLAQQGYIVASFDNHGTPAPRGRAWRKSIYRQVGILASADQAAATRAALAAWPYADPARVGVWGWSGGGSMTLNAMFRYPDLYKTGVAVASVPVQHLYDSVYQERYMGLPKDNEEGFKNGSPITFAKDLRGSLLIVHGTGDDNVHYQGFEMLVNELVAAGRTFDMMSYPNRSHGLSEGQGTTLHVYSLFTRYLREHLPL